jgi:glycosyltransferase involved in cell wall biosynthesis
MAKKRPGSRVRRKRSLRIAQLHWGFPPVIGGVETHLSVMLPTMVKMGHRVELITASVGHLPSTYDYRGVKVFRTPSMDLNWLYQRGTHGLEQEIRTTLGTFLKNAKPDLIHAHNFHYFSKVHAEFLQEFTGQSKIPLILTAHNVWDDNLFLDLVRKVDWSHIIAVSHFIKGELMGVGVEDSKITVVYHGIDYESYARKRKVSHILKKYPQLEGRKVVFHPARMGLGKGCDVSIKALNILRKRFPDVLLVLAGTKHIIDWGSTQPKDIAYMVNLVEFFNLRNNILIDAYSLEQMPALYQISDVCIYPSTSPEPFGLTMLEALASGKPMVVTEMGGMPEIIKDRINGFVIPVRNYEVLAARVRELLANPGMRERLGRTGREMVRQSYTRENMTVNTLAVYRQVLYGDDID